uniref:Chromosome 8 open reading frame 74 n=1 Tax=Chelonoidis abingdonii TaxID=106734 RepID=A0A8C0H047_CHEAB
LALLFTEEGRQCLRALLRWKEFDDVGDLRRSIELDSIYSSIVFAVEKGLSWPAVVEAGKLAEELLNDTKGLSVSQAICVLRDKLVACEPKLSPFKPCVLCEYFYHTLIRHYQLYQFVLCRERDVDQTSAHLEICVPPQPLPLTTGVDAEVWHYQQQLAALSAAEVQKRTNMLLLRETLHREREHMLQRAYHDLIATSQACPGPHLLQQQISMIGTQIQALREILQTEIQTTFEILDLRLQKRALILNPPVPYPPPPLLEERAKKSTKAQLQKKKK